MSRRFLAVVATLVLLLTFAFIFTCWFIAIWDPWGNGEKWGITGAAALFLLIPSGMAALILWTGVKKV